MPSPENVIVQKTALSCMIERALAAGQTYPVWHIICTQRKLIAII
jgi:hypothetical protein